MSAASASLPTPGYVSAVEAGSFALQAGVRSGDALLAVNGHAVQDVVDVLFYGASPRLNLTVLRAGHELKLSGRRAEGQPLGLQFTQTTFDIDIRRCNNLCPFCFVLQAPNRLRRALYIKDDDYRYSFLHGHFVTLTNLNAQDWARIRRQRLSPLYVSVHATETSVRRACLRNETAPDVMAQLRKLARWGIRMHTQLVVTPGLNDGAHLERSVRDLATLHPAVQSVSVVPVGLTRQHNTSCAQTRLQSPGMYCAPYTAGNVPSAKRWGFRLCMPPTSGIWWLAGACPPKVQLPTSTCTKTALGRCAAF